MSFGQWVRYRRRALGLTQTEVAARAGMAQSNLASIEANRRGAGAKTMTQLRSVLSARPSHLLERNRAALLEAARDHGVSNLRVFGSVARGEDHPGASDIDLLVDLPEDDPVPAYLAFAEEAARILTVPVDVVVDREGKADEVLVGARAQAAVL